MAQYAAPQNGDPSAPDILEFSYGAGQDCRVVASIDGCFFFMEMGSFAGRVLGMYANRGRPSSASSCVTCRWGAIGR